MKREKEEYQNRSLEAIGPGDRLLEAVGTSKKGGVFLRDLAHDDVLRRQGRYLPHWSAEGVIYHVRFSLVDSIPAKIRQQLRDEKDRFLAIAKDRDPRITRYDKKQFMKLYREKVESVLNAGYGACWLARDSVGELVADALSFFDGDRYKLLAWCVMPNHVHVVLQPGESFNLQDIIHSWKSYTANKANMILKRTGNFWQREYFDRIIRDNDEMLSTLEYVFLNPKKAGLIDWKWRWRVRSR